MEQNGESHVRDLKRDRGKSEEDERERRTERREEEEGRVEEGGRRWKEKFKKDEACWR